MSGLLTLKEFVEQELKKPFYRRITNFEYLGMEDRIIVGHVKGQVAVEEITLSCGHKQKYYHTGLHWEVSECKACKAENKL